MENIHKKLERIRKPRVHIKYEVETENARIEKELPFVVGILGDFSGETASHSKPLKEKKFIQIDRDNFNEVMNQIKPELNFKVENTIENNNSEILISLKFTELEDFEPTKIVYQVPILKELLETRNKLQDLITKIDRSEELENFLEQVLQNNDFFKKLSQEIESGDQHE